jgi:hypothetical protein
MSSYSKLGKEKLLNWAEDPVTSDFPSAFAGFRPNFHLQRYDLHHQLSALLSTRQKCLALATKHV